MFHHPGRSHVSINVPEPADRQQLVIGRALPFDLWRTARRHRQCGRTDSARTTRKPDQPDRLVEHASVQWQIRCLLFLVLLKKGLLKAKFDQIA
jgi:hypothetical protein